MIGLKSPAANFNELSEFFGIVHVIAVRSLKLLIVQIEPANSILTSPSAIVKPSLLFKFKVRPVVVTVKLSNKGVFASSIV